MRINQPAYLQSVRARHFDLAAPRFFRQAKRAILVVGLAAAAFAAPAQAEENIGGATTVVNLVTGDLATGDKTNVVQGDAVFKDEGVRTDADSSARLILRDNTNLLLGPSSSIKLDRFVYAGPSQPGAIAVNLVKGALRFATGDADKKAYVISTPTAALGVRGTVIKILAVSPTDTLVLLDEGGTLVCVRSDRKKKRCLNLTKPGQAVEVTATGIKWNSGAAGTVAAVIDAIPDAPPGSQGTPGEHAAVTPVNVAPPPSGTPPAPPKSCGDCNDNDDDGDDGESASVKFSGKSGHPGPSGPGAGHGPGGPSH
jgi:ferric-dicitrate binding protein FerR (iron transport regulator)